MNYKRGGNWYLSQRPSTRDREKMKIPDSYRCAGASPLAIPGTFAVQIPTPVPFAFLFVESGELRATSRNAAYIAPQGRDNR